MGEKLTQMENKTNFLNLLVGIPFLCDANLIGDYIEHSVKQVYKNLISNGSEKKEVLEILDRIPDGKEREVASFINNTVDVMNSGRRKRRMLGHKVNAKPHLHIVQAIRSMRNLYSGE